jgi:deferrochelatase/peroxidase EfeB
MTDAVPALELDDIQSGVLRPRPSPYAATYILLRIDERRDGRELLRRLAEVVTSAAAPERSGRDTFVSVALTFDGLKALGVPQASLDSFCWEFRQGMAARGDALGDFGESAPERWDKPFGTSDIHVILVGVSPDAETLEAAVGRARAAFADLPGVAPVWRQDC